MARLSRRRFIQQSSLLATAGLLASTPSTRAIQPASLPIIDTHQHLWDLTKFQPPWLADAPEVLSQSYTTREFLAATQGLNVVKAVYMEIDVAPEQQLAEAEHVTRLAKSPDHPTCGAVISGRPNSTGFKPYLSRFKDNPYIKGVRQVLHVPSAPTGMCLQPQFVASMRLLGEFGMSYDLCMRPTELADGAKLAAMCPETRFIVDHCGNADPKAFLPASDDPPWHQAEPWRRDMGTLAQRDNVICKISGIIARAPQGEWEPEILAPIVNTCLAEFGPDRVVFGGDWPVCLLGGSYARWVYALKAVVSDRPLSEQKKLFHDNAARLYRV